MKIFCTLVGFACCIALAACSHAVSPLPSAVGNGSSTARYSLASPENIHQFSVIHSFGKNPYVSWGPFGNVAIVNAMLYGTTSSGGTQPTERSTV